MIDLSVFTVGNLAASVLSGLIAGMYLAAIHPPVDFGVVRRSALFGWFLGFPLSILYAARIGIAIWRAHFEAAFVSDLPRLTSAWILAILFSLFVALGAWIGYRLRTWQRRQRERRRRGP